MPTCGHPSAQKFTADQPCELKHYFCELELLLANSQIVDDEEKKSQACCYVDVDTSELWESIVEFTAGINFNNFKRAIFKLYPGSEEERKWSIVDMDKHVGEQLRISIYDINDLGSYYRSFYTITKFLINKNCLSNAEQSHAFIRGFQSDLWNRILCRLELKFPDHYPDNHYDLGDIHEAAKHVLHAESQLPRLDVPCTFDFVPVKIDPIAARHEDRRSYRLPQ
jgi:hypothetical protein